MSSKTQRTQHTQSRRGGVLRRDPAHPLASPPSGGYVMAAFFLVGAPSALLVRSRAGSGRRVAARKLALPVPLMRSFSRGNPHPCAPPCFWPRPSVRLPDRQNQSDLPALWYRRRRARPLPVHLFREHAPSQPCRAIQPLASDGPTSLAPAPGLGVRAWNAALLLTGQRPLHALDQPCSQPPGQAALAVLHV